MNKGTYPSSQNLTSMPSSGNCMHLIYQSIKARFYFRSR